MIDCIEYMGYGPYYDLHVPGYENYLAQGLWHHNSAKTVGLAVANGIYTALHPGEPHIHVSPVKDQAQLSYQALLEWGTRSVGRPSFFERFVSDSVVAPFPEIRFKPWHAADPGNTMKFRPLGDDDIERLRSMEAGTISVDEAFRTVENARTYAQLRGCIRGINQVKLALLPAHIRQDLEDQAYAIAMAPVGRKRDRLQEAYDAQAAYYRLNRRNQLQLYGNAGPWDWEWDLYDQGDADPQHYFSLTVTSYDNPALGKANLEEMKRAYGDDLETMAVEMEAQRPGGQGEWFKTKTIARCVDPDLLAMVEERAVDGVPGYDVRRHFAHGIYKYQIPPELGDANHLPHHYVLGADPGSGKLPGRNKWAIMVYDITTWPATLVYFEMGNLLAADVGDFKPFWRTMHEVIAQYPLGPHDAWVESTGPQKGMEQLAFPEDLRVVPVSLAGNKPVLLHQHRTLMAEGKLRWPNIERLRREHGNYDYPDTKLVQDLVMTAMCASGAMWRYVDIGYDLKPGAQDLATPAELYVMRNRYQRPMGIEVTRRDLTTPVRRSTFDV